MIITASFSIPHVGASPVPGAGILAVADVQADQQPVVLMVDMQGVNQGASLTNAAETAITHLASAYLAPAGADPVMAVWIELDSMGIFDEMLPSWRAGGCDWVDWQPLRYRQHVRTLDAFTGAFGQRGEAIWQHALSEITRLHPASPHLTAR